VLIVSRTFRRAAAVCVAVCATLFAGVRAEAQSNAAPPRGRVELWGAATGVVPGSAGTLVSSYSPPLLLDGEFTSHAGQTLIVDTASAIGVMGGVNVFVRPTVGFQLIVDRSVSDVKGTNAPYVSSLQYVSRQPPDNQPQSVDVNRTTRWPDTSGSLERITIAFNAIARIGRPEGVNLTMSAGPSYLRVSGTIESLAFTAFHLGGHSVLFEDDHRLALALGPAHGVGFDVGGEVNAPVAARAGVVFGFRYTGGSLDGRVAPTTVLNSDEVTFEQPLDAIAARLALAPMRISVRNARVFVGFKITS
jgi:hypothetical protein